MQNKLSKCKSNIKTNTLDVLLEHRTLNERKREKTKTVRDGNLFHTIRVYYAVVVTLKKHIWALKLKNMRKVAQCK